MENVEFFKCEECGSVSAVIGREGTVLTLNGKEMLKLNAGTTDGAPEKHVPIVEQKGEDVKVSAGSVLHPAEVEHYIDFIALVTDKGVHYKKLEHTAPPVASFKLCGERVTEAYLYCNKHGLWKTVL